MPCFDDLSTKFCGIKDGFLQAIYTATDYYFMGFLDTIFWMLVVILFFKKYNSPLYAGIVGLIVVTASTTINAGFTNNGLWLFALSLAITIFAVIWQLRR